MCITLTVQAEPAKASFIISIHIRSKGVTNDINKALVPAVTMAFAQPTYSLSLTSNYKFSPVDNKI